MPGQERPRSYSSDLSTSSENFFRPPVADPFTPIDHLSSLDSDDQYPPAAAHVPIIVPYEPIPIPREPTLEEILREASQSTTAADLDQVKHLKLCVISDNLSLQRVAAYCPLLTSLTLDGSLISTLRDLGCMLENLRYLDVSRCGLRSLDGTSGLGSVTHLVANWNQIEYLDPCSFLDELQELSVQGNVIRTVYNLHCLSRCPLRTLHVNGNPIEEEVINLPDMAKRIIPSLVFFNGQRVREEEPEGRCATNDNCSHTETSSGSFSSFEKSLDHSSINSPDAHTQETPIGGGGGEEGQSNTSPSNNIRTSSSTAARSSTIISGATTNSDGLRLLSQQQPLRRQHHRRGADRPLSASLIRLREQHRSLCSSTSSGGGTPEPSSDFEEIDFDKQFPLRLPQAIVPLELGVVGTVLDQSSHGGAFSDTTTTKLLVLAQQWRKLNNNKKERPQSAKGSLVGWRFQ